MIDAFRLLASFLLASAAALHAQTFIGNPDFVFSNDVAYVPGGGPLQGGQRRETMDIYRPAGTTELMPVLLLIHGGGWNSSSNDAYIADKNFLATGDYIVATMKYRLNTVVEPLLEQVDDVKAAIRFLKANAGAFGIDPEKLGLYGNSAGAHLASLAALTSETPFLGSASDPANQQNLSFTSDVLFVVDWAAPPVPPGPPIFDLAPHISAGDPAFQLFHGTNDSTVGIQFARDFRTSLVAGGVSASMVEISGGGHFPVQSDYDSVAAPFLEFIDAQYAAAPEPGSAAMLLAGATLFSGRPWRRSRAAT